MSHAAADAPPVVVYHWGEDAYGLERAARSYRARLEAAAGATLDVWRAPAEGDDAVAGEGNARLRKRVLDDLEQRLATGSLFGAGTLAVVRQPGWLVREAASRARLIGVVTGGIAPGNALCFLDLLSTGSRAPAAGGSLRDAVAAAGGHVTEHPALTRERLEGWLSGRARELGSELGPGAARLLAERVGAYVREGDVDRRRQSELANAELEKLALYRPQGLIRREDVAELVAEAVPGSTWAMLDAVGGRRDREAALLLERLLAEQTPLPVLISQLHRRLRDLLVIREHLDAGTRPPELVRALKLQPFRAQKLAEQARAWTMPALESALDALLELDLLSKGINADGSPRSLSEDRSRLALIAWAAVHAGRAANARAGS